MNRKKQFLRHPYVTSLGAKLGYWALKGLYKTQRWTEYNRPTLLFQTQKPCLIVFWHNRLLMTCFTWQRPEPLHILGSRHFDSQFIGRIVQHEGIHHRSNGTGLKEMRHLLRLLRHESVALTPDGPKGPCHKVKPGVAVLSRLSKTPIIPLAWMTSKFYRCKSWDGMYVPKPWGRGAMVWGDLIHPKENESNETLCQRIEGALNSTEHQAKTLCGLTVA